MKTALIQHNFNTGFGDSLVSIFEYIETVKYLKNNEYNVSLNLYAYFNVNNFFDFFNKNLFNEYFDDITYSVLPITTTIYKNLKWVYSINVTKPGQHLWDLFLCNKLDLNIPRYDYSCLTLPAFISIFNDNLMEEYSSLNKKYGLINNEYSSIYFRVADLQDECDVYDNCKNIILSILNNENIVYACSNSYAFKTYIQNISNKVICYNIPDEIKYGNHYNYNFTHFDNLQLLHERTKYVIFEMLTLSDSKNIDFFTTWKRGSNFLFLSKIKNIKIKQYDI